MRKVMVSNKFQLKEKISDQEKTFFATHAPQISNELYSSQWKYALVIEDSDGENILNYLYNFSAIVEYVILVLHTCKNML